MQLHHKMFDDPNSDVATSSDTVVGGQECQDSERKGSDSTSGGKPINPKLEITSSPHRDSKGQVLPRICYYFN